MESRYGTNFEDVRIHEGPEADARARSESALAFTLGRDIVFSDGAYRPGTPEGDVLLAHELAHAAQQQGAPREPDAWRRAGAAPHGTDGDERDANDALLRGAAPRQSNQLRLSRCNGTPDSKKPHSSPAHTPAPAGPPGAHPKPPPAPQTMFEQPGATTTAGAPTAFSKYRAANATARDLAFDLSYNTGNLKKALTALGPKRATSSYNAEVRELLAKIRDKDGDNSWTGAFLGGVEREVTEGETGKSVADMGKLQATTLKAAKSSPGGWGGVSKTRWQGLLQPAKNQWTADATAAVAKMVAYAKKHAPALKLTTSSFSFDPDQLDQASLGALAAVGPNPGKDVLIGFEFVALIRDTGKPEYALSTVAHELRGHVDYDVSGSNFQQILYDEARKSAPSAGSGHQNFHYWASEIYSLLQEVPYWTQVTTADQSIAVKVPGQTKRAHHMNYDPKGAIDGLLQKIQKHWHKDLGIPLAHGFYRRLRMDPNITPGAVKAFEAAVKRVFAADAPKIIK